MKPTLKQLRYFSTVVELGSFRQAAQRLGISQPTLTAQIAALENAMETQLLERSHGGTLPTPMGRAILPHVHNILKESREIQNIISKATQSPAGTHRLGVPYTLGPYFLPEVIPEIHRSFPAMRIFVKEDTPQNLERGLQDGTYDFILTPLPLDGTDITCEPLFSEPLYVVAPPDHPLVAEKGIMPKQLIGENFLVIEEKHLFFLQVQRLAAQYGLKLLYDFAGTSLDTLRQMIGTGLGLSFLPALYIRSEITHRRDVVVLDTGFNLPSREIVLAWRPRAPQKHLYLQISRLLRQTCRTVLEEHVIVSQPERK